ncbi:hypothetical protein ONE63_004803 [Megalurothrips usitatus]|uniref:Uncharacterized protein n=1 Tax=Megalurothrips usitatus TaxID=439358 RepID=A0AAV7X1L9_9NEOP|nr:hypothetical protein ONE63_004803 [Megalurothrips usitatus]
MAGDNDHHHHPLSISKLIALFDAGSNNNNKKNRSSSPLSDVSVNSTTNTTSSNRTKSATLPTPRATAHGGARERSARDKAESADVLKKNQRNKTTVTPVLSRTGE